MSTTEIEIAIPAPGASLAGTIHRPAGRVRAAVVLNPATGTPAGFYAAFARWLAAERDCAVLLYDHRQFGRSPGPRGRAATATMTDWGIRDQQAARDWLARRVEAPLWVIGHSLGGLMLPFQTGLSGIARVVTVGSGAVHLSDHPWPYRAVAAAFWHGPGRLAAAALGHVPGRLMGIDPTVSVPRGVYRQWRIWCTSRGFTAADPDLPGPDPSGLVAPMRLVAAADDDLCPPAAVWRLMRHYPQAPKEQLTLRPTRGPIGHHGAFRRANAHLWPALVD
ncbi:alpha/beta hydrolase [Jannaschia sp. Os4]|uniref:alpha/beta hydrolase family protein n=1 Tax=Jannaschia sp. Os4 TaxID=2807617 RepID=UPI00193A9755|nr:alpha/beta hydrolase [Jannaschia sp. Os4]MBM2577585.1 alpha/beta hydrolase [Jannaschia sp. Os4]